MTAAERTRALTLVDEDSAAADQSLLSVLVAASNPVMARTYQQVVLSFGPAAPEEDDVLFDVIEADTEHVHRFWKHR
ncbi:MULTISPECIES: hypothetical protein [Streptomyces]|jgi:anthranilate/para-aminobenzoate synthase component II|uniref:hypothetical protein n=1 Tax=Streptomyces TaxID=1883 RepID=UPI0006FAA7BC|nr:MULTISPECIES: hypothetical protein [unclassified Streptomyces]KQX27290.1 hypothetical protein ASD29_28710 [Streptomyces sp. Root1295]KRA34527.1 hypothetical protein ASD97_23475 [Streptomyces sp. Root63]MDF9801801.1 anthranilate/para-aminobenzoate synthase component II [Streptomyces sp. HB372]